MSTPLTDKGSERRAHRTWRVLTKYFKPNAKDIVVFFVCSAIAVFRVPMPVETAYNFSYTHPLLTLVMLFPVLAWVTGAYVLGAVGLVNWIVRFFCWSRSR